MIKAYFQKLFFLWRKPVDFFSTVAHEAQPQEASAFAALTAVLVSLELGLQEALSGGSPSIVAFVTLILLVGLPFVVLVCGYLWVFFIRLTGFLLGTNLGLVPHEPDGSGQTRRRFRRDPGFAEPPAGDR